MEAIRQFLRTTNGSITIDLPKQYDNQDVEVIILPINQDDILLAKKEDYDFSDIMGKLQWNGDGLAEQQKLRNEW
jgi:hypothetical protein